MADRYVFVGFLMAFAVGGPQKREREAQEARRGSRGRGDACAEDWVEWEDAEHVDDERNFVATTQNEDGSKFEQGERRQCLVEVANTYSKAPHGPLSPARARHGWSLSRAPAARGTTLYSAGGGRRPFHLAGTN